MSFRKVDNSLFIVHRLKISSSRLVPLARTIINRDCFASLAMTVVLITCFLSLATSVSAQGANPPAVGAQPAGVKQLEQLITRIINLTVPIAFIALTVVLVMAGIKFITSGGEPKAIGAAGQTITWAFLGILFMVLAWLILSLIQAFTGVQVTQFSLKFPGN